MLRPMYNTWATGLEWMSHLESDEVDEVLEDRLNEQLSAHEVLEAIVGWRGGVASADELEQLVNDVYSVDLGNYDDLSWVREECVR